MTQTRGLLHAQCCYLPEKEIPRFKTLQMKGKEFKEPPQRCHLSVSAKEKEYRLQTGRAHFLHKLHFEVLYLQLRKLLRISYLERETNEWVRSKINFLEGPQEVLLAVVKRGKLAWFGHVTRHDSLSKTIV